MVLQLLERAKDKGQTTKAGTGTKDTCLAVARSAKARKDKVLLAPFDDATVVVRHGVRYGGL